MSMSAKNSGAKRALDPERVIDAKATEVPDDQADDGAEAMSRRFAVDRGAMQTIAIDRMVTAVILEIIDY